MKALVKCNQLCERMRTIYTSPSCFVFSFYLKLLSFTSSNSGLAELTETVWICSSQLLADYLLNPISIREQIILTKQGCPNQVLNCSAGSVTYILSAAYCSATQRHSIHSIHLYRNYAVIRQLRGLFIQRMTESLVLLVLTKTFSGRRKTAENSLGEKRLCKYLLNNKWTVLITSSCLIVIEVPMCG